MPPASSALIRGLMRTSPSTNEYSLCTRRWTNEAAMNLLPSHKCEHVRTGVFIYLSVPSPVRTYPDRRRVTLRIHMPCARVHQPYPALRCELTRTETHQTPAKRSRASRYLAAVSSITSCGKIGRASCRER